MVGPADVVKAATNLQSHATSNVGNVSQAAALEAVTGDLSAVAAMREAFDRRRQTIVSMLREIPGVACPEPQGAFYVYPSVKGLLGRPIAGRTAESSVELAELILEEAEVAVVPGRGVRDPRLPPDVLRARGRRPDRGRQPAPATPGLGRVAQAGTSSGSRAPAAARTRTAPGSSARAAPTSVGVAMVQALAST